jgi:hypothetical protein
MFPASLKAALMTVDHDDIRVHIFVDFGQPFSSRAALIKRELSV